jgi:nucleoside-diphosphate-sugar epimerase
MARPRVLVTGAAGFIGRATLAPLRAAGYEVCAVLSPRPDELDRTGAVLPEVEVRHVDLTDPAAVDALLETARPTHLLHFAWIATPGLYWQSEENYRWLSASRHLLAAFGRCGGARAVMAGSCAEYDWSRVDVCRERSSPLADEAGTATPYAACKIAMQRSLEDYGRSHGVSTAWGRIFFQYGPGEHRDRLIASVIVNLLAGREARCTHGRQIRSFLHVEDVGAAFAALLASPVQGPVNIGSGDRIAITELLERLAREIGRPDLLKLGARAAPPGEPALLAPDLARLREEVRWSPRWPLDEGLKDTVRWWRARLA